MPDDDHPTLTQTIELIQAGRISNLTCPFCFKDKLKPEPSDYGTQLTCPKCKKYIDAPDPY